jgi:hypothetical protein
MPAHPTAAPRRWQDCVTTPNPDITQLLSPRRSVGVRLRPATRTRRQSGVTTECHRRKSENDDNPKHSFSRDEPGTCEIVCPDFGLAQSGCARVIESGGQPTTCRAEKQKTGGASVPACAAEGLRKYPKTLSRRTGEAQAGTLAPPTTEKIGVHHFQSHPNGQAGSPSGTRDSCRSLSHLVAAPPR